MIKHTKIFLDGADRGSILEMVKNPLIAGFTTNPSLMRKAGVTDYEGYCKELLTQVTTHPISFEVFADDLKEMGRQARMITKWGKNVVVKIPIMNTKRESTAPLIRELTQEGIALNVTAIFTLEQVAETCQALKGGASALVSVFAGRIADVGQDPIPLMIGTVALCKMTGPQVKSLWASTREAFNIVEADRIGCDIITAPLDVVKKVSGFGKSGLELSYECVKTFKNDSDACGFRL